tara:strand:- start:684 stop:1499 length:816 start_codon:yes stop_codon:yes gene_type:complete
MAVNINTVYQTVLYILNKEQRGYIPPAEFNSLAAQVQDEIFQSYFPDGNQVNRLNQNNTQNDTEFFNMFKDISYKLYPFEIEIPFSYNAIPDGWIYINTGNLYKIGNITATYNRANVGPIQLQNITQSEWLGGASINPIVQLTSKSDYNKIIRSKLTAPTQQYPICYTTQVSNTVGLNAYTGSLLIKVFPKPDSLNVNCLLTPSRPQWNFTVGSLGQYIYSGSSVDFQLDISEKTNIITNILKYAGVIVNDPTVIQVAEQEAKSVEINTKS